MFTKEYEIIIEPDNFIKNFKNKQEFETWVKSGTPQDIDCAIKEFEKYELYEHCQVMLDIRNEMLQKQENNV